MKRSIRKFFSTAIAGLALTAAAGMAEAAFITIDPLDTTVATGTTFDLTIVGQDFFEGAGGTIGGGLSLAWDPSLLTLNSVNANFPGDQTFGQPGTIDNAAGTLTNLDVTSFIGTANPAFDIAILSFTATNPTAGPLTSPTDLSIGIFAGGTDRIWADSDGLVDTTPEFRDGTVTVNPGTPPVPVPAAVWLFGSGLIGLVGIARRKRSA